jgi:hypothetical protein
MSYEDDLKEINFKYTQNEMATTPGITKKDREVIKYGGVEFYTNEKLRQKFIMTLLKNTPTKSHKTIIKLINEKIIIPAFLTKSTLSYYLKHFFTSQETQEKKNKFYGAYGFYAIKDKKIFVLIDTGYKILTWVPDHHLAAVTLHESMHMAAKQDPTKFMRVNVVPLYQYYSNFLGKIFDMKGNDKKSILDWVMYIQGYESNKHTLKLDVYSDKILKAVKPYSKLSESEIEEKVSQIVHYTFKTHGANSSELRNTIRSYPNVYYSLMGAYQKAFKIKVDTIAYQELFTVSEVLSMLATTELGKNKYVSNTLDIIL